MKKQNKLKYIIAAAGVLISAAFYVAEFTGTGSTVTRLTDIGHTGAGAAGKNAAYGILLEDDMSADATVNETGNRQSGSLNEGECSNGWFSSVVKAVSGNKGSGSGFRTDDHENVEQLVRLAVREELYAAFGGTSGGASGEAAGAAPCEASGRAMSGSSGGAPGEASAETLIEKMSSGLAGKISEKLSEELSEKLSEEMSAAVRTAVREELIDICSEGYLELAVQKAAELAAQKAEAEKGLVNINTAPAEELTKLPGIGEKRAGDIVLYRQQYGRFKDKTDIMNISGIKEEMYNKIKDLICV